MFKANEDKISLRLTDIVMPGMDGLEIAVNLSFNDRYSGHSIFPTLSGAGSRWLCRRPFRICAGRGLGTAISSAQCVLGKWPSRSLGDKIRFRRASDPAGHACDPDFESRRLRLPYADTTHSVLRHGEQKLWLYRSRTGAHGRRSPSDGKINAPSCVLSGNQLCRPSAIGINGVRSGDLAVGSLERSGNQTECPITIRINARDSGEARRPWRYRCHRHKNVRGETETSSERCVRAAKVLEHLPKYDHRPRRR